MTRHLEHLPRLSLLAALALTACAAGDDTPVATDSTAQPIVVAPGAPFAGRTFAVSLTSSGVARSYRIHFPTRFRSDQSWPLVFAFHGWSATASTFATTTGIEASSDANDFIAVLPDGLVGEALFPAQAWNGGDCCDTVSSAWNDVDDVGFVDDILARVQGTWSIDATRIYAMGHSNGGFFAHRLACERASVFAAYGVYGATSAYLSSCAPSEPVSALHIHGTSDTVVATDGTLTPWLSSLESAPLSSLCDVVRFWRTEDACTGGLASTVALNDWCTGLWVPAGASTKTWQCTGSGGEVVMGKKVRGAPHDWPTTASAVPFDTMGELWSFFAAHPK